jgi:RNA-directed DNA polymerase
MEEVRRHKEHWPHVKESILAGTYIPQPVKRVDIPKPSGKGVRSLDMPVVLDRFIQQMLLARYRSFNRLS